MHSTCYRSKDGGCKCQVCPWCEYENYYQQVVFLSSHSDRHQLGITLSLSPRACHAMVGTTSVSLFGDLSRQAGSVQLSCLSCNAEGTQLQAGGRRARHVDRSVCIARSANASSCRTPCCDAVDRVQRGWLRGGASQGDGLPQSHSGYCFVAIGRHNHRWYWFCC